MTMNHTPNHTLPQPLPKTPPTSNPPNPLLENLQYPYHHPTKSIHIQRPYIPFCLPMLCALCFENLRLPGWDINRRIGFWERGRWRAGNGIVGEGGGYEWEHGGRRRNSRVLGEEREEGVWGYQTTRYLICRRCWSGGALWGLDWWIDCWGDVLLVVGYC